MSFESIVSLYAGLAGIGALIALVINILKTAGVVQDGTAQTWSAGLNLAALVGVFVIAVAFPAVDLFQADAQIGTGVQAATVVFGYIVQLLAAKGTHAVLRGVPVVGKSLHVNGVK